MTRPYLIDTNVLVSLHLKNHSLYDQASIVFENIKLSDVVTNQFVVQELATVLLVQGKDLEYTKMIIEEYFSGEEPKIVVSPIDQALWNKSFKIFFNQARGKLSLVDCSLIAQARLEEIKTILTFDKDLKREFKGEFEFL